MALLTSIVPPSNLVIGATASTDNAVVRFDGATGKIIQNSNVTIADDGTTVISVNSATDALRINQTGAGNALVVEDSTNPDSTPFVINADGVEIVGASTAVAVASPAGAISPSSQQQGNTTATATKAIVDYNATDDHSSFVTLAKSATNTIGAHSLVASGEKLGVISFQGSDGTAFIRGAEISSFVDGTPGTNDMPGRLVFSTTADGASTPTERMRIDSAGVVTISNSLVVGSTDIITEINTKTSTGKAIAMAIVFG